MTITPLVNWRAQYDTGASSLPIQAWPGYWTEARLLDRERDVEMPHWVGSLVEQGRDGTGQLYRRHRYYDPGTGRFTQEDPIGLAGGLNLYGYAGGDPVNFADPFGLCPQCLVRIGTWIASHWRAITTAVGIGRTAARAAQSPAGQEVLNAAPAVPRLATGPARQMLGEAVGHLRGMPGADRASAFQGMAQQIEAAALRAGEGWRAVEMGAVNARVFVGEAGEAMVFGPAGQVFRGNIGIAEQFTRTAAGLVPNYEKLRPIIQ